MILFYSIYQGKVFIFITEMIRCFYTDDVDGTWYDAAEYATLHASKYATLHGSNGDGDDGDDGYEPASSIYTFPGHTVS